jgi:hypothetical protein
MWRWADLQVRTPWAVEDDVAFAFEGGLARGFPEQEALAGEPAAEVRAFSAALRRMEAGDGRYAVVHQSAVAEEDHVRAARFGVKQAHVRDRAEDVVEALPLRKGQIAGDSMGVAGAAGGHPGVQDVVDRIPLGRTHQEGGAGEERRGGEKRGG